MKNASTLLLSCLGSVALLAGPTGAHAEGDLAKTALVGQTKPAGPYTPGVVVGQLVFLSGQVGRDPATNKLVEGGVKAETRQAMVNLGKLLKEAGLDFGHVVKSTVFLADIKEFAEMNAVYGEFFNGVAVPPARSTVQAAPPNGAQVEIEFIAVK
jgi:2-iminobutanoate/2-iminopropanoate deaminase